MLSIEDLDNEPTFFERITKWIESVKNCLSCNTTLGSILVLLSAFVFSIMTLFVDAAGERGIPSFEMMIVRCVVQLILSAIYCYFIGVNPLGTPGNRLLPVLRGIFGPLSTNALYYGATKIAIADATTLKFTSPIWTLIIARIVLGEKITIVNTIAIGIGFLGVVFVAQPRILFQMMFNDVQTLDESYVTPYYTQTDNYSSEYVLGTPEYALTVLICLAGAVCSSCVYVIIRKSGGSVHYQVLIFYYGLIGIFSSAAMLFLFEGYPVIPTDWISYVEVLIISLCGFVAQILFNRGAQMIDSTKTAVFRSTDVIFVLFWQVTLLHEMPTWMSLVGISLICTCTIIMAFAKQKKVPVIDDDDNEFENDDREIELESLVVNGECNTKGNDDDDEEV